MRSIFITGTDTGVGKTYVTTLLLKALQAAGLTSCAMKPIASGCRRDASGQLRNDDALALQAASSLYQPYTLINPMAYEPAIAPHVAAQQCGERITAKRVQHAIQATDHWPVDVRLIEGAGGWALPLNDHQCLSSLVVTMQLPVILVVGMRLGCLNHARLTAAHLQQHHAQWIGWIADVMDPHMEALPDNIATLTKGLKAPCLGVIEHGQRDASCIDVQTLWRCLDASPDDKAMVDPSGC